MLTPSTMRIKLTSSTWWRWRRVWLGAAPEKGPVQERFPAPKRDSMRLGGRTR